MPPPCDESTEPKPQQPPLPLAGVTVIELDAIGPVPFATHILRQMGATIIIIVPPEDRALGLSMPARHDYIGNHKQRITLDLKSADGRAALLALARDADVLIEGFRPGTLERLDLGPEVLRAAAPGLVLGRCSGWDREAAHARSAGHDINYLGLTGALASIGQDTPQPPLNLVGDYGGAAMHLVAGILAALWQTQRNGQGAVVDTSILAGGVSLMTLFYGMNDAGLWRPERSANILDGGAPYYCCYRTADGLWMALGAIEAKFFREFAVRIDADIDPTRQHDRSYWPILRDRIGMRFALHTRDHWEKTFAGTDCCCTPVLGLDEVRSHADVAGQFEHGVPRPAVTFTPL